MSIKLANNWKDFEVLGASSGEKFERWSDVFLLRPDPQVIWKSDLKALCEYKNLNAKYQRSSDGGGHWVELKKRPDEWVVGYKNLKFLIKPMGFKHTGLFPEQAVNWDILIDAIKNAKREISVLNLFGYTGGATVACLSAGASVCHVDASKAMVERCRQNVKLSGLENANCRYIVDDCFKFVEREIRRQKSYDIIIMDPPSYGRGPNGEMWKLENNLFDFVMLCKKLLTKKPLCFLINSYTTGLQPSVLENLLKIALADFDGEFCSYELGLPIKNSNVILPCGASGLFLGEK